MKRIFVILMVLFVSTLTLSADTVYADGEDLKSLDKVLWNVIYYNTGSAKISEEGNIVISESVNFLKSNPGYMLYIAGHTDTKGGLEMNGKLSLKRAVAVRDAILSAGIPSNRVDMGYYSYDFPAIPQAESESDRAKNRRVEIYKKLLSGNVAYEKGTTTNVVQQSNYYVPETTAVQEEPTEISSDTDVVIIDETEEPVIIEEGNQADNLQDYEIPLENDATTVDKADCSKKTYFGDWKNEPCNNSDSYNNSNNNNSYKKSNNYNSNKNYNSTSKIGTNAKEL